MNGRQITVLWLGVILVLACVAYPPYEIATTMGARTVEFVGYHFIASPPQVETAVENASIDTIRLLMQLGAIGVVIGGLYFTVAEDAE